MAKCYTGVGSRETPDDILDTFTDIAKTLHDEGYILRSGGAEGADTAFEEGAGNKADIYLPWREFNDNPSELFNVSNEALRIAASIHPNWGACRRGAQLLHGRNVYQVLGDDLENPDPSKFLICWTKDGREIGGTRTAIVLAKQHDVPVYNFGHQLTQNKYKKFGLNLFLKGM